MEASVWNADGSVSNIRFGCAVAEGSGSCTRTDISSGASETLVEGVTNGEAFAKVLGSDLTGTTSENGALEIRLDVEIRDTTSDADPDRPLSLLATVKPRNCVASPAVGVLNPPC